MFGYYTDKTDPKYIPGYTGHIPEVHREQHIHRVDKGFNIPGYAGFVKGIKSENMYGKTFGETTQISKEGNYHKGHDLPSDIKYISSIQENFKDQIKIK